MLAILPLLVLLADEQPAVNTKLVVNWWTPNDIAAMTRPAAECGKQEQKNEPFAATLLVCPGDDPS